MSPKGTSEEVAAREALRQEFNGFAHGRLWNLEHWRPFAWLQRARVAVEHRFQPRDRR